MGKSSSPGSDRDGDVEQLGGRAKTSIRRPGLSLRGAALSHRGWAILLPSGGRSGTSSLVAALVRAGAAPIVDGVVALDDQGRVDRPMSQPHDASAAGDSLEVAIIVDTAYDEAAVWQPKELLGVRAVLPILDRATAGDRTVRRTMHMAAHLAPRVVTLSGSRPEADRVAPAILAYLDQLIDGRGTRADAAANCPGPSPRPATEVDSLEVEREQLLAQPSLVMLHWHGRFGNRMHQYAYGATYARLKGHRFWLPSHWEGTHLFENQAHSVLPQGRLRMTLNRCRDSFAHGERRLVALHEVVPEAVQIRPTNPRENYADLGATVCFDNVCAYHPSIFTPMSRTHLLSIFALSAAVKRLDLYKRLEDRQGTYDIAHLRRDDISNAKYNQTHVQGYSVISKRSYEAAFAKFGFDPAAVEWVSDDYAGQWHTDRVQKPRGRWRYPAGSEVLPDVLFDWLEDFLRLYFARTIFRANSSFSWWAAFLSPCARVFSPVVNKKHIYGVDGLEEIDVDFVEGNLPHWMYNNADIRIGE